MIQLHGLPNIATFPTWWWLTGIHKWTAPIKYGKNLHFTKSIILPCENGPLGVIKSIVGSKGQFYLISCSFFSTLEHSNIFRRPIMIVFYHASICSKNPFYSQFGKFHTIAYHISILSFACICSPPPTSQWISPKTWTIAMYFHMLHPSMMYFGIDGMIKPTSPLPTLIFAITGWPPRKDSMCNLLLHDISQ